MIGRLLLLVVAIAILLGGLAMLLCGPLPDQPAIAAPALCRVFFF